MINVQYTMFSEQSETGYVDCSIYRDNYEDVLLHIKSLTGLTYGEYRIYNTRTREYFVLTGVIQ